MSTLRASTPGTLRLAPTHAAAGRWSRLMTRAVAAGAAGLGAWLVLVVENGALGTLAGAGLILLTPALGRGSRRAHRMACALLLAQLAASIAEPGADRGLMAALLLALLVAAPAFRVVGDPATRRVLLAAAGLAALAAAADAAHAAGYLTHPLVVTTLCGAALLALRSLRPWQPAAGPPAEREHAARLIERYATDTLAPFALRSDKRFFFDPSGEAFLAYRTLAGVAMISGDPIGSADAIPGLLDDFLWTARRRGWVPAAIGVSAWRLRDFRAAGFHAHYTGDEAIVDPGAFSLEGRPIRKVRQSVARLERHGYHVRVLRAHEIDDDLAGELGGIAARWRQGRAETGFSMAFRSAAVDRTRDDVYAVAFDEARRPRGFLHLAVVPAGRALSLSSMRRDRATPNGLNEQLVCETLAWAREQGFGRVSLNFAAFGRVLDPPGQIDRVTAVERRVLRLLSGRFQLERLLAFNRKFAPDWSPRYVVYPSRAALPRIGLAALLAEAYLVLPGRRRT